MGGEAPREITGDQPRRGDDRRGERVGPREDAPWRCTASQPRTAPGTVTVAGPASGIVGRGSRGARRGRRRRGPAGGVDRDELAVGVLDEREQIAADAALMRVDDGERDRRVEGRVHGVAAVRERGVGGVGGERMGGRDGPASARRGEGSLRPARDRHRVIRGA